MKILHLLKHGQVSNGSVHVAVDLACAQSMAGHDVVFAAANPFYTELMTSYGVDVVELVEPSRITDAARYGGQLAQLCRRRKPDIVNAHMMSAAALAFPVTKALGTTLVTTMHNSFDTHSWLMRLGRAVIAVSEAERNLLVSRGYRPEKVVTVMNGAIGSPRDVTAVDLPDLPTPCVMTLSGLHPRKAVHDVIAAFAEVSVQFPDWHLNVVGSGPDARRLQELVDDLGLGRSVHLLGGTLAPRRLLERAAVFATATLADPCPLTVMEARGAGCAVVATEVGGIPEVLAHGRAGQLVPVHDVETMAARFRTLMGDAEELARWRARSSGGAEFYSVARMAEDHLKVYESIVLGGPLHRPAVTTAA